MLITILVSLYSTRIILNALGERDYGIFSLVSGTILLLSFLNAAMTTSTQRYFSFFIGSGDEDKLTDIFKTSVILHLLIGFLIVFLLEIVSIFLFHGFLNIPQERLTAAKAIYHFMVVSTFFTINAVPYDSAINAHENLLFDAVVGVVEVVLKLAVAISLLYIERYDLLIWYGLFIAIVTITSSIIKSTFCLYKYPETKISNLLKIDMLLFREMFSFSGWNLFGAICGMGRSQGLAIILNLFFGPVINAAYGIANQVNSALLNFSQNMLKALNPQIMKSEGANDRKQMLLLAIRGCKYAFFLLAFFTVPLLFETKYVLSIWLGNVPKYAVVFCRLTLLVSMLAMLTAGLRTAIQATGRIRAYQSIVGGIILLNLPLAWLLLKIGLPAYIVLVSAIVIELLASVMRVYFLNKIAFLSITNFLKNVIMRVLIPLFVNIIPLFFINSYISEGPIRLCVTCLSSSLILSMGIYFLGFEIDERRFVISFITMS
ncbi:MAG: hypothetical protein CSA25_02470 [Desulfobacter postgatei]|uniref:Polysaccharide biosynthesis protein n=1 Tax=Desulfobacter postgatei TaxID=2293 RepID=A0A2G6MSA6_9BACT|nr:MAG: hypothetical protein CSA25_02470 [Desulfobacter postgatei]